MTFSYKNKKYSFPTSLCDITLRQRIEFDNIYGQRILELQKEIYKKDTEGVALPVDDVEEMIFNIQVATFNFSFFTGIPLEEVENHIPIESVLTIYHACFQVLYQQQEDIELKEDYLWNDQLWKIEKPELTYQSEITFNELIVSKQIVKQMHDMGAGQWESMPFLAAIFLKREGEVFDESWLSPDSERVKMMYDLPMDIAMAVGFFLAVSMSLFTKTLAFSEEVPAEKAPV